jgi:hypothetical protein
MENQSATLAVSQPDCCTKWRISQQHRQSASQIVVRNGESVSDIGSQPARLLYGMESQSATLTVSRSEVVDIYFITQQFIALQYISISEEIFFIPLIERFCIFNQ